MRRAVVAAFLFGLIGCAGSNVYIAKEYGHAGKVAVLPIANESNDLDGPIFIRKLILDGLYARGFQVLPMPEIDAQLKTQGFTDGGQLHATTPQKIAEWTGADSLLYCTLESFDYVNVGFYSQRKVKVLCKMMDGKTGSRLWEAERDASTRAFAANKPDAERLFAAQLAVKAVEKMTHTPLQPESRKTVAQLLNALPYR